MGDDGVGVHVAKHLEKLRLPRDVKVVDAGARSLDVLLKFQGVHKVILIDAVRSGQEPGTIYRLTEQDLQRPASSFISLHELAVEDSLRMARQTLGEEFPRDIVIFGVEVESVKPGRSLSPKVSSALPKLLNLVLEELQTHPSGYHSLGSR